MTDNSIWDQYWQTDRLASCLNLDTPNYSADMRAGWSGFFTLLPDGARVLDICTGNGAIAAIAVETGRERGKSFDVHGVDGAEIDPARFVTKAGDALKVVTFHGKTAAEALPFEDGAFDAVTSNYGIEYSDRKRSLPEAARVLKSGGRLRFVVHATEGTVMRDTKTALEQIAFLVDKVRLYALARRAIEAVVASERNPAGPGSDPKLHARAIETRDEFQAGIQEIVRRYGGTPDNAVVMSISDLLIHTFSVRGGYSLETLVDKVEESKRETLANRGRLIELSKAAVTEVGARGIATALEGQGLKDLSVQPMLYDVDRRLIGWQIAGTKA
ncbi:MAG: methyltransferase domain-containing protein [Alphaproteobacteria bacterium]|nr:methyltransferase domain-containing protein [Alphaproteobacteria bacterium]